ncbi:MAG TPA: MBL fold metallo-hydrolase [Acidimicrobiales bacterium]|nr:MBL fold metallo-hydrolase [Acidimicrobiales bacterium]
MDVITIETPSLGDRSYVVHDGEVALVVDPQRDVDRVLAAAEEAGVRITHVAETHVHNDYVSGGLVLSRMTGADHVHAAAEPLRFDHRPVADGDTFAVGSLAVEVVHTPGHTPEHLSYVVRADGSPPAAFTGGSLLYGTVGRTDLISEDMTDELTRAQHRSAHRLAEMLPDETRIYPTHGFGSFCASASSDEESDGTLACEKEINLALTVDDEDAFVERLVEGLTAYPRYYAQMGPMNLAGGVPVDLSPPAPVDPIELGRRIHRGEWVVDLRDRKAFAADHLAGTVGIQLEDQFVTYLGWLIPWATPVTLLGDSEDEVAEAQRQMVRIGIDRPAGAATGPGPQSWAPDHERRSYPTVTFEDVARRDSGTVLDVRRYDECEAGHIEGAVHIPIDEILQRLDDVPADTVWVHCASGFRASIAASLLDRAGKDVVLIDDEYENAAKAGLEEVEGACRP